MRRSMPRAQRRATATEAISFYDASDELAGSCQDLFAYSEGKGLAKKDEIVLQVGTGHGILYQPLDEWVIPVIEWAGKP